MNHVKSHCLACGLPTYEKDDNGHPYCFICQMMGTEDMRHKNLQQKKIKTNHAR